MSFRERIAWITFFSIAICYGVYFWALVRDGGSFGLFLRCVIALVIVQAVLTAVAAARHPGEANAPADERERLIDGRAHSLGYYVLLVGVLSLAVPGHTGGGVIDMLNHALAAIVVAELSVCAAQIVLHRRGA